jgi:hypothetical protein
MTRTQMSYDGNETGSVIRIARSSLGGKVIGRNTIILSN